MRHHTILGHEKLTRLAHQFHMRDPDTAMFSRLAASIAYGHHEQPDGTVSPSA